MRAAADGLAPGASVIEALNAQARGSPRSFVAHGALPDGVAYESFISATGTVPTRENLHDFFNGLVWLSFPRIKQQLNTLQAAQIALAGVGNARGAVRDGATLFDENAALLVVRESRAGWSLMEALRAQDWRAAFVAQRASFGADAEVWLFGHALMEKLVAPYKAITAHTRFLLAADAFFTLSSDARRVWIDTTMAQDLATNGLSAASFTPLPVLGVPGWWEGQDQAFYADAMVFRPKRNVGQG